MQVLSVNYRQTGVVYRQILPEYYFFKKLLRTFAKPILYWIDIEMSKVQSIRKFNIVIVTLVLIINTVSTHSQSVID